MTLRKIQPIVTTRTIWIALLSLGAAAITTVNPAAAQSSLKGRVLGAATPVANATVTLWAASVGAAKELAHSQTGADGRFELLAVAPQSPDSSLYLTAKGGHAAASKVNGDNPAIALLTVLGSTPPTDVTVNEMTTVASVWTHAQFIDGTKIQGHALGLRIAAGNVPNFVDLATGGWGEAIQGPLNSGQTPTMANFATLADVLAGCVAQVAADACAKLFVAATPPKGGAPTDTLTAAQSIARNSWYKPKRIFALLDQFYPVPTGKNLRPVPFMPYLKKHRDETLEHVLG